MSDATTRVVLVRHGQTDWNVERRIQGGTDTPLNATGRWQAQRLAERLRADTFSRVLCSDALRARETVAPLAQASGLEVRLEPMLRERRYGIFEGLRLDSLAERDAEQAARLHRRDPDFAPDGGESLREVSRRAVAALLAVLEPGASVLVVTHGGVLDCLYRYFTDLALQAPRPVQMRNAALNVVDHSLGRFSVERWGDEAHLAGAPGG